MHTRTGPTEFTGNALADALRTTGDDDDLVLEIHQSTLVKISGELSILGNIRLMIISYTLRHRHTTHPNLHPASAGSLRELPRPRTGKDGMPPSRDIFPPPLGGSLFSNPEEDLLPVEEEQEEPAYGNVAEAHRTPRASRPSRIQPQARSSRTREPCRFHSPLVFIRDSRFQRTITWRPDPTVIGFSPRRQIVAVVFGGTMNS